MIAVRQERNQVPGSVESALAGQMPRSRKNRLELALSLEIKADMAVSVTIPQMPSTPTTEFFHFGLQLK